MNNLSHYWIGDIIIFRRTTCFVLKTINCKLINFCKFISRSQIIFKLICILDVKYVILVIRFVHIPPKDDIIILIDNWYLIENLASKYCMTTSRLTKSGFDNIYEIDHLWYNMINLKLFYFKLGYNWIFHYCIIFLSDSN